MYRRKLLKILLLSSLGKTMNSFAKSAQVMFVTFTVLLVFSVSNLFAQNSKMDKVVNVYSQRQSFLIDPLLKLFTEKEGIKVRVVFARSGIVERILNEGKNSPADVVLTSDSGLLYEMVEKNLAQSASSIILKKNIPSFLRSDKNEWFGLTTRARIFYVSVERGPKLDFVNDYQDLSSGVLSGRVCMRSGYHPYNVALFAWLIAEKGEPWFRGWIKKLKQNLARKPQGNDRDQAKAIRDGLCDVALGNSYYYGAMVNNASEPQQKLWARSIRLVFPNQITRGAHVNISGALVARNAPNRKNAIKLLEFLSKEEAQSMYAESNYEFPVNPAVPKSNKVPELNVSFKASQRSFSEINQFRKVAIYILNEIKFDE